MKKINFLIKLKKEGKLKEVKPSKEISDSYAGKSESNIISAKILFENNRLEESISLTYYSMYNMLTALLFQTGIKCENHAGSIILLKEIFKIDNSEISFAKSERVDKQYYTSFKVVKEEVTEAIEIAENFNKFLFDFISKLNNAEIRIYKERFMKLFKL